MTMKRFLIVFFLGASLCQAAAPRQVLAFQNLIPSFGITPAKTSATALEDELIEEIASGQDRLANSDKVSSLVSQLEQTKSIPRPAISPEIMGRWRLLQTTNTDTSSPIQRKAVDTSKFPIYQDIVLNDDNQLIVSQIVKFSDTAELAR